MVAALVRLTEVSPCLGHLAVELRCATLLDLGGKHSSRSHPLGCIFSIARFGDLVKLEHSEPGRSNGRQQCASRKPDAGLAAPARLDFGRSCVSAGVSKLQVLLARQA